MNSRAASPEGVDAPFARSLDGRRFRFGGHAGGSADHGQFVTLQTPDGTVQLGQVEILAVDDDGLMHGEGVLHGLLDGSGLHRTATVPFGSAEMRLADAEAIELVYTEAGASLAVGTVLGAERVSARLLPHRFNRHTFWCGQSGSGKTYALGVLLEQLLIQTRLPLLVFDPNADFVRLTEPSVHAEDPELAAESALLAARDIRVLRPGGDAGHGLLVRFTDLAMPSKAAVLRLDPLGDRAEYNELLHLEERIGSQRPEDIVPTLLRGNTAAGRALAARIENLRLLDWGVWAGDRQAATDVIEQRPDATVLDLGGFDSPDASLVVALAVLDDLWAKREKRRPVLIVIDEAHNLCAREGGGPLLAAVRERITQIAAEGRKFGLWLLLSTQRPSTVAPGILAQCDNLAVMKMSSPADLDELATRFGFAPQAMLARSPGFRQGEAFFSGGFVPAPSIVSMRTRLTREGGADVRVPLRADERAG